MVWAIVAIAHLAYRAKVDRGELPRQSFRLAGSPWTDCRILAFILLVFALLFYVVNQHIALYAGAVWAGRSGDLVALRLPPDKCHRHDD